MEKVEGRKVLVVIPDDEHELLTAEMQAKIGIIKLCTNIDDCSGGTFDVTIIAGCIYKSNQDLLLAEPQVGYIVVVPDDAAQLALFGRHGEHWKLDDNNRGSILTETGVSGLGVALELVSRRTGSSAPHRVISGKLRL